MLTTKAESTTAQQTDTEDLARVSATGDEIQVAGNGITEETPSGSAQRGDVRNDSTPVQEGTVARARTELPRTAGNSPLVALIGVLMLVAAALIRCPMRSV